MMTPKLYPQNLHTPPNIQFSDTRKNIEIQNFETLKNGPILRIKISENTPPLPHVVLRSSQVWGNTGNGIFMANIGRGEQENEYTIEEQGT